jgi:AcrR family transcriptional regulator
MQPEPTMSKPTAKSDPPPAAAGPAVRRRRADATRNRERLIAAATEAFREHGLEAGVAEIARHAGVGSATLFRNFRNKDELIHAVIEKRVEEAQRLAERALEIADPATAFSRLLFDIADLQAQDLGFFEALRSRVLDDPELFEHKTKLIATAQRVLERAQRAGAVRADVVAEDLRFLLMSVVRGDVAGGAPGIHRRYLRIILDGLRPVNASDLTVGPAPAIAGQPSRH